MERIGRDRQAAAARTLAEAFGDDPLMHIVAPDERKRRAVGAWFFERVVEVGLRWGRVWGNEDTSAVAVWLPPGDTDLTTGRLLRTGFWALPFKAGLAGTARFGRAMSATEALHHAVQGPHWYLLAVGTRAARRGQGLGSALVELGTSEADAAGASCYLETGTQANVDFYARRGFEVTGEVDVEGFRVVGMVRPPR